MKVNALNENSFGAFGGGADPTMGASYNVQGRGPGYVYSILPFNNSLQQKVNDPGNDDYYIYPGCLVRGVGYNNPSLHYTGIVNRIVKDSNGEVRFLYIKTLKTNRFVSIAADDNLELIINSPHIDNSKMKSNSFEISNNMRL